MPASLVVSLPSAVPCMPVCSWEEQRACPLNSIVSFARAKTSKRRSSNSLQNSHGYMGRSRSAWETDTNTMVMAWSPGNGRASTERSTKTSCWMNSPTKRSTLAKKWC